MQLTRLTFMLACLLTLASCAVGGLHAFNVWTRPTPQGEIAAVYFEIHNDSRQDDAILGASTEAARVVELHESMTMGSGDGEQHMMMPVERVELLAGQEVIFEPGGLHLMLVDLQQELVVGDLFTLVLDFEHAVDLEVVVTVADQ